MASNMEHSVYLFFILKVIIFFFPPLLWAEGNLSSRWALGIWGANFPTHRFSWSRSNIGNYSEEWEPLPYVWPLDFPIAAKSYHSRGNRFNTVLVTWRHLLMLKCLVPEKVSKILKWICLYFSIFKSEKTCLLQLHTYFFHFKWVIIYTTLGVTWSNKLNTG